MEDQNNLLNAKRDHHKELDRQRHHAMAADAGTLSGNRLT